MFRQVIKKSSQFSLTTLFVLLLSRAGAALPVAAADLSKTLRVLIPNGETGIDPATASDANTGSLTENIFDPLLRYDYLARPLKLQPNTVSAMPEVSGDGRVYTFRLRPGIYFTPDPAFKGKRRELTADDYVYSFKRIYDPALKSPWLFLFENKIVGDLALLQARKAGEFDHRIAVPGLRALDRYTLRVALTEPDSNFLFKMAMPATGAVAREVMSAYAGDTGSHPVGTGPYLIKEWQRASRILLEANPDYRAMMFDGTPGDNDEDRKLADALRGKRLPIVGRIEVKVIEEQQPRVLGFLNREFDYLNQVPAPLSGMVLTDGKLRPELAQRGIALTLFPLLQTNYMWMNMEDPVLGGYSTEKVALRRAIALGYDRAEDVRILQKGLALPATTPLPPDVLGYDAAFRSDVRHDPVLARQLLERFGYRDRDGDGYREAPDGKPLTLVMHSIASTTGRLRDELWRRSLDEIGIRVVFKNDKYTEIIKASRLGRVQMFDTGWVADFPDGENYFQLLYSANVGGANYARFRLAAYDQLYLQSRPLPESPERRRLYKAMSQTILAYTPWVLGIVPLSADVCQPWLKNYKRHPVENTSWRYLDIDLAQRAAAK